MTKNNEMQPLLKKWESQDPVSILMPVCNEEDVIEAVIEEWMTEVIQFLPKGTEFVFDEAASTDRTREIIIRMVEKYPIIKYTFNEKKDGFGNAARRLYKLAKNPWIFFVDSDGQYLAADFWKLAKNINCNYDFIRGAKIGRKDPLFRRIASGLFNKWVQFLFNLNYLDFNSAFFLIRKEVMDNLIDHVNCMETLINTELLLRTELENYNIKQVYILHRSRKFGFSRGLQPMSFIKHAIRAVKGLYKIKASYRIREIR